jgi:hypothetical protein
MTEFISFVSPVPIAEQDSSPLAAASECLDRFTAYFNACDAIGMDGELYFPHVMFSGASRLEWKEPGQHPENFFVTLKESGWHHTCYESKVPILVSQDKVHFVVTYSRRNPADEVLSLHKNLWIVIRAGERWQICLRSY